MKAVEKDYLHESARTSRIQWIRNEDIRNNMVAKLRIIERIEKKSLK